jgi:hypothetical protein
VEKKYQIRFQIVAEEDSPEATVLDYLTSKPYQLKDMVMLAVLGLWLPPAHRDNDASTPIDLIRAIHDSSHRLKLQLQYFEELAKEITGPDLERRDLTQASKLDLSDGEPPSHMQLDIQDDDEDFLDPYA